MYAITWKHCASTDSSKALFNKLNFGARVWFCVLKNFNSQSLLNSNFREFLQTERNKSSRYRGNPITFSLYIDKEISRSLWNVLFKLKFNKLISCYMYYWNYLTSTISLCKFGLFEPDYIHNLWTYLRHPDIWNW